MTTTTVREGPILFRSEMVRAILSGAKTQTRRLLKSPTPNALSYAECGPAWPTNGLGKSKAWWRGRWAEFRADGHYTGYFVRCPYGVAGDRIWVRETWAEYERRSEDDEEPEGGKPVNPFVKYIYRADYGPEGQHYVDAWRPSIFMPRDASRLTLEITRVRVERLEDISEEDALAEGCETAYAEKENGIKLFRMPGHTLAERSGSGYASPEIAYCAAFQEMHQLPPGANPWHWVVEFKRVQP